jgi:2,3-dihydroxy-p-cumate/2,3-dihydroxybenzoate 3,4-dioxygenase
MVMISIEQLRYVRLGTPDLDRALDFASRVVGLELVGRDDDQAWFRSDYRDHTLVFVAGDEADQTLGIEVRDQASLESARADLEAAGLTAADGDEAGRTARKGQGLRHFHEPGRA